MMILGSLASTGSSNSPTMIHPLLMLVVLLVVAQVVPGVRASGHDSNSNVYSFGYNPNEKKRRMYFPDGISVLRNLGQVLVLEYVVKLQLSRKDGFTLYVANRLTYDLFRLHFIDTDIRFHNCAWSPNSMPAFDDDGEYYDGEDAWYQGRTGSGSAANAGFSLFGTLKNRLQLGGCRRATYINSFFTDNGADVLVQALGLNVDNSYTYCHEYEWNNENNENYNQDYDNQGSGDNDNNNNLPQSATLGCTAEGRFATALFTDEYCSGAYFWNTTADGTYNSYNKKLNGVHCRQIWNGKASETANGYASAAHEVLLQSQVCDTRANALCPNPWGKKAKDEKRLQLASSGSRTNWEYRVRRPFMRLCHVLLCLGLVLTIFAYRARNKERLQSQGWINCISKDLPRWFQKRTKSIRKALSLKNRKKRTKSSKKRRSGKGASRDYEDDYDTGDGNGCGQIMIDDSHDVMEGSPSYEMT